MYDALLFNAKETFNNALNSNSAHASFGQSVNNARAWSRGDYDDAGFVGKLYGWLDNALTGNRDYNRQLAITSKEMAYNAAEAQKQRDFEERLSNTSYQRAAADAIAAGYNPALIIGQGGASTPSGYSASVGSHNVGKSGEQFGYLLTNLFGLVGTLVATGMRTSAMEAAQDIRGHYIVDAAKLRGNNAIVISKSNNFNKFNKSNKYLNNRPIFDSDYIDPVSKKILQEWKVPKRF